MKANKNINVKKDLNSYYARKASFIRKNDDTYRSSNITIKIMWKYNLGYSSILIELSKEILRSVYFLNKSSLLLIKKKSPKITCILFSEDFTYI